MKKGAENFNENVKTAIREQFGQVNGPSAQLQEYSPKVGYLKYKTSERLTEAFVLSKTPKIVVERHLSLEKPGERTPFDNDFIYYTTANEKVTMEFECPDSEKNKDDLFYDSYLDQHSIDFTIPTPNENSDGPNFATIYVDKNFKPQYVMLPFLDKEGLLKNKDRHPDAPSGAMLRLTKKDIVRIFIDKPYPKNPLNDWEKKGSFHMNGMFILPDTNHGYKVTHENNEWAFSQYNLEDMENPRLIKRVGIKDIEMKDVNAALKGDLKAWSSLPERILTPIINN